MSLPNGTDMVTGERVSFQWLNRLKNAFRRWCVRVTATDPQPGMALSDSEDNRCYHTVSVGGSTTFFEILQAEVVVCMNNQIVCFNDEVVTAPSI